MEPLVIVNNVSNWRIHVASGYNTFLHNQNILVDFDTLHFRSLIL